MDKQLTALLRTKREKRGLTQQEVAQQMGTSKSNISRFEKCVHSPTIRTVEKYVNAIGHTIEIKIEEVAN